MSPAVGIMAYNEGANIARAVRSVLDQAGPRLENLTVVLVASGCTDDTVPRAVAAAAGDPRFRVLEQPQREGKAAAIALFLREAAGRVPLVLVGADTILEPGTLEALLTPFDDPTVGMTGGHPVPVNDASTAMGRVVHVLWELHHRVALEAPKLGELVAFRPVFETMPVDTAVDEAAIESLVLARGFRLAYAPEARVRMKGPATVREYLDQRRRIHAGHLRLARASGHAPSTMSLDRIRGAIGSALDAGTVRRLDVLRAAALEATARLLGAFDSRRPGRDHRVWKTIPSTKDLAG